MQREYFKMHLQCFASTALSTDCIEALAEGKKLSVIITNFARVSHSLSKSSSVVLPFLKIVRSRVSVI